MERDSHGEAGKLSSKTNYFCFFGGVYKVQVIRPRILFIH